MSSSSFPLTTRSAVALSALFLPAVAFTEFSAHAQSAPSDDGATNTVTVTGQKANDLGLTVSGAGSRLNLPVLENPSTIQVITANTLNERQLTNVLAAETQAAGVTNAATPGNGATALSYRGFQGVGAITELYDGLQLQVASGTVSFPFDAWNVDRIEVLGGPATVLYGQGGVGGTVNVIPRRPDFDSFHSEAMVSGGSYNTFQEAVDSTGPLGHNLAYRVDVSHISSDGYVKSGQSDSVAISVALAYQPSPDLKFTLSDDYGNIQPMNYWGTPLINGVFNSAIKNENFEVPDAKIEFIDNWTQLRTDWTPSNEISITNSAYALETHRHWRQLTNYVYQPATGLVNESSYRDVYHQEYQYGDQVVAAVDKPVGSMSNKFSVGTQLQYIWYEPNNNTPFSGSVNVNPFNPQPGPFKFGVGDHPIFKTSTTTWAGFAEDQLKILPELSLVGSVRYDSIDVHYTDLTLGTKYSDGGFNYTRDYATPSGRVGLVYEPIKDLSLYAQYSTGNGSISNVISTSYTQAAFGLADGRQVEVGAKQDLWGGKAQWTFAAYQILETDILTPNPTNPTLSEQVGAQTSRGLESSVSVDLGYHVSVEANGTILRAKFKDFSENVSGVAVSRDGNVPTFIPERAANLFLTWDFLPDWQVRGSYQYVGHRYANNANTYILPSYGLLGLGLRWKATEQVGLDLKVDNALNQLYAVEGVTGFSQYILGEPFSVSGAVRVKF